MFSNFFMALSALALTASFGAVGAVSPTSGSSPSSSETAVKFEKTDFQLAEYLGMASPATFDSGYLYSVGSFLGTSNAVYTMVFTPKKDEGTPIAGLEYVDNLELDSNKVFTDVSGDYRTFLKECQLTHEGDDYASPFGVFSVYLCVGVVPKKEDLNFRFCIKGLKYSDDGLTKDEIAVYRNFEPTEFLYNFASEKGQINRESLLEVENHFDAFNLSINDKTSFVQQDNYSCFSFSTDVSKYGDIDRLEIDFDRRMIKWGLMDFGATINKSDNQQFCDQFKTFDIGPAGFKEIKREKTELNYRSVVDSKTNFYYSDNPLFFWNTRHWSFSGIEKTSDAEKTIDLNDEARKYDYICFFDQNFFDTYSGVDGAFDYRIFMGSEEDAGGKGVYPDEQTGLSQDKNISYLRFWFNKDGVIIEIKAIDDHVQDTSGKVPLSKDPESWVWDLLVVIVAIAVVGAGGGIAYNAINKKS